MTTYCSVVRTFLDKISDYKLLEYSDEEIYQLAIGYMKRACVKFNKICEYDLLNRDDENCRFNAVLDDEVIDILTDGMIVEWLQPYLYNSDNLENVLSTKDYTLYSTKNLLDGIRNLYNEKKKDFTQAMREYSYCHGDLTQLHI